MKLKSVKSESEITLLGHKVEFVKQDGELRRVIFKGIENPHSYFEVALTGYSDMRVFVPEPPKKVKRFRVLGKYLDLIDVSEDFEYRSDAVLKLTEYAKKAGHMMLSDDEHREKIGLEIQEVETFVQAD